MIYVRVLLTIGHSSGDGFGAWRGRCKGRVREDSWAWKDWGANNKILYAVKGDEE